MMLRGGQYRVIFKGTLKQFMVLTGLSRDYISDTGNADELKAADSLSNTLLGRPLGNHNGTYKTFRGFHDPSR